MPGPWYRARQFARALRARVTPDDLRAVDELLTPGGLALFQAMPVPLQRHHLNVYHDLRAAGCDDPDILVAALLHDCGKGHTNLAARVAYVLLGRVPGALDRVAASNTKGMRGMLYRHRKHPSLGAAAARQAGLPERVAQLIEQQEAIIPEDDPLRLALLQLQSADNRN